MPDQITTYVIDAGSIPRKKFAWVSSGDRSKRSRDIEELAADICQDIAAGRKVSIGIECALFIPCTEDPNKLGKARAGDCTPEVGSKPFSASPGACATMTGLPALAWVLRRIKQEHPDVTVTTRWDDFRAGQAHIFLWEAFVSGKEKAASGDHHDDALLALDAFEKDAQDERLETRVTAENPFSLAAAAILWAGLSEDVSLLHEPCVVLRPLPGAGGQ